MVVLKVIEGWGGGIPPPAIGELVPVIGAVHVAVGTAAPEDGTHLWKVGIFRLL